ncbi:hypothetical protein [Streptomyces sp. NPDC056683]|uniref:hypothetical protein n=1 Tax=Streptomyces sp. NPDC056683 TaxID=3345910 RepID=UPI0036C9D0C8
MSRSPGRLGELLRAARALGVSDTDGLTTLAAALGLALATDGPARRAAGPVRPFRGEGPAGGAGRPGTGTGAQGRTRRSGTPPGPGAGDATGPGPYRRTPVPPEQVPGPDTRSAIGGSLLLVGAARPAPGREAERPEWPDWREAGPPETPDDGAGRLLGHPEAFDVPWPTALPRPAPPWDPRTQRAVFLAMAGTRTTGRAVDHPRLVDLVVRSLAGGQTGRPRVPYRQRTTTRAGALLLIDRGESMRPFRHDQEWITRLAGSILPPGGLRVLDLRIAQGVSRDRGRTWEPHPVPPYGQPVLLLSDLGHLRPPAPGRHHSPPASWLPYLRRLREAGNPVVCLTPYPAEEYPAAVRRTVALVPLDRRVSVRLAQTAARQDPRRARRR